MHQQNTQTNLFKNNFIQDFLGISYEVPRGSGAAEGVSILRYKLGKSAAVVNTPQIVTPQSFPLPTPVLSCSSDIGYQNCKYQADQLLNQNY